MRLAVYHNLPSGGASRALYEYSTRLAAHHSIDLYRLDDDGAGAISHSEDREHKEALEHSVDAVHGYRMSGDGTRRAWPTIGAFLSSTRRLIALQQRVADDINRRRYDVVFVHPCRATQTPALLWMLDAPTVYYMQEPRRVAFERGLRATLPSCGPPLSLARRSRRYLVERQVRAVDDRAAQAADLILANSYYSVESIYRAYGREASFCPLGVDGDVFGLSTADERQNRVLSVGALVPHKGHELVIRSAGAMPPARRPRVGLVCNRWVPEWQAHLEGLARAHEVELELHHAVTDERLVELYQTSMATFCAARLEPFGLTVLESMCCGTPVIAVREGGFREIVTDGENGILIDRDPHRGATAIETIADGALGIDPAGLRASVLPSWSWDRAAEALESRLSDFVADGPSRGQRVMP